MEQSGKRLQEFLSNSERRWEWRWPLLLLAGAAFFLGLFYWDYSSIESEGDEEVVGKVIYKSNVVQRRNSRNHVWSRVERNTSLRNQDIIQAQKDAGARIELKDGTRIDIDEESMFKIDLSEGYTLLDLDRGSIKVQSSGRKKKNVVVRSGDKSVAFQDSDVLLQSDDQKSGLAVQVEEGEASVQAGGDSRSLRQAQQAKLTSQGAAISDIPIRLQEPAPHAVLLSLLEKREVIFRWELNGEEGQVKEQASLEVAHDSRFLNMVLIGKSNVGRLKVQLPAGSYYWRVKRIGDRAGGLEASSHRKLTIVPSRPLQLLSPRNEARITYVQSLPRIYFSWTEERLVDLYILEIADNRQFSGGSRQEFQLKLPLLSVENLPKGSYYWRVKRRYALEGIPEGSSKTRSFRIEQISDYASPTPQTPPAGQAIDLATVTEQGIFFSWKASEELRQFQFELDRDPSFQNPVVEKGVEQNYTVVKRALPEGLYYWRTRGKGAGGRESGFSAVASFRIQKDAEPRAGAAGPGALAEGRPPALPSDPGTGAAGTAGEAGPGALAEGGRSASPSDPGTGAAGTAGEAGPGALSEGGRSALSSDPGTGAAGAGGSGPFSTGEPPDSLAEQQSFRRNREYSLPHYRQYIAALSRTCPHSGLPDILIRECFVSHVTLNLSSRYRRDLYAFLKVNKGNYAERLQGYLYFQENCSPLFRATRDLLRIRRQDHRFQALLERDMITKTVSSFQVCPAASGRR